MWVSGAVVIVSITALLTVRLVGSAGPSDVRQREKRDLTERDLYGFTGKYPKECLKPVAPAEDGGLVASFASGRVAISNIDGQEIGTIHQTRLPISFNPDGRLLAAGPRGHLWRTDGEHFSDGEFHSLVRSTGKKTEWSWSPISSCLLHVFPARWGRLAVTVASAENDPGVNRVGQRPLDLAPRVLIEAGVKSFSIAPDGKSVAIWQMTHDHQAIYIADLESNVMQEVVELPPSNCCLAFAGWSPDGRQVLYWARPGRAIPGRGWILEGAGLDNTKLIYAPLMFSDPSLVERCGEDLIAVVGGGPPDLAKRKLAELRAGRKPRHIRPYKGMHSWPACSPDGSQIAFVTVRRSALSHPEIAIVGKGRPTYFAAGGSPQWLEWTEHGLLFIDRKHDTCYLELNLDNPLQVTHPLGSVSCLDLDKAQAFDWSASPPDGLPVRRSRMGA